MASSGGTDGVGAPLLAARSDGGRWWKKVVDVEEGKIQMVIALPMVLTNVFYYIIPLVSVMFAGHLGELQLAASTLANSWATVTGYAFMLGLSGALETLCGQAFGARCYKMLGVHLQSACIISFLFSIIISIIWWYTEPILIFLHQNPDVSKQTAIFLRHLIPGIFAFGTIQNILRFLQTQSVVYPLVICSLVPLLLHLGLTYVLVHFTPLGFRGAALSTSIAFWISALMLIGYMNYGDKFKQTWRGLSKDSLNYVLANLKLGLPSAAMVCLEYWAFEILVLLAGLSPNSETSTSLIAMCVNTEAGTQGLANNGGVISLNEQIKKFEEVTLPEMEKVLEHKASQIMEKYLFLVAAGNNDFELNYLLQDKSSWPNLSVFVANLSSNYATQLQRLYNAGARKFALLTVYPIGCTPVVKQASNAQECVQTVNRAASYFNVEMMNMIDTLKQKLPNSTFVVVNTYKIIRDIIKNPVARGFRNVTGPCCELKEIMGVGMSCKVGGKVCRSRNSYVYFDGQHNTEAVNSIIAERAFFSDLKTESYPFNLQKLALL